ncbi:MAG: GtrA family protein [Alphaproteobacteria bacterium]|nr:GtrA family protein [Alphaproteobacteria bacterium]MBV8412219.1 GtrA family protein [Alphaproteobacteria bacterium]
MRLSIVYTIIARVAAASGPRSLTSTSGTFHDLQTFILYTGMGVVTTLLFWVFAFAFNAIFQDKTMRYVGAPIGLGLGCWAKYYLDKRFVFRAQVAP